MREGEKRRKPKGIGDKLQFEVDFVGIEGREKSGGSRKALVTAEAYSTASETVAKGRKAAEAERHW